MDFFFSNSTPQNELSSPVGVVIKSATDPARTVPNWQFNMDICDQISSGGGGSSSREEVAEKAVRALHVRLQDPNPKTVSLTLTVAETCVKNCGLIFASVISKSFMDEMVNVSRGAKGIENRDTALRLIQLWGTEFDGKKGNVRVLSECLNSLKARGVNFPPQDTIPENYEKKDSETEMTSEFKSTEPNVDEVEKLRGDLNEVMEKIRLCREMLPESPGIESDEILSEVVGFLEACRDRMAELIEAGAHGLLGEDLLCLAFKVNDALLRTLEAEKNGTPIGLDDLDTDTGMESKSTVTLAGTVNIAGSGSSLLDLDDIFGSSMAPSNSGIVTGQAELADDEDDEFSNLTIKTSRKAPAPGSIGFTETLSFQQPKGVGAGVYNPNTSSFVTAPAHVPHSDPTSASELLATLDLNRNASSSYPQSVQPITTSGSSVSAAGDFNPFPPPPPADVTVTTSATGNIANTNNADFDSFLASLDK